MLAPEEEITGVSEKKTYTIKTVEDAKAYFQRKDKKFIEHLDKSLEQWLNAINEDSTSYSMLSDHPIVVTNDNGSHQHMGSKASLERVQVFLNNQEKNKPILEDPELEDSEISKLRVNQELIQLLSQYKGLFGSELETISIGLQEYINFYQAADYSGSNNVTRKEEIQGKRYSWLMLQLFPVALFISINLAKNERPDPKIFDIIENKNTPYGSSINSPSKKLACFEKIGSILEDLVRYCFCKQDTVGVSTADKPHHFRDSQYKFLLKELKNPTSAVLCERKPRHITPYTVEDASKMFALGRKPKRKNNPEHWMELYDHYSSKESIDWITDELDRQKKRKRPMTEEVKKMMDLQQADAKSAYSTSTAITESKNVQ